MNSERVKDYVVASYRHGVRKWLREHDATNKDLADIIGCDRQYIAYTVSNGGLKKGPTLSNAALMALGTGMTLDELCGLDKLRDEIRRRA